MIKYRTSYGDFYSNDILKIDVEKENEHSVWIDGRSVRKHTSYFNYWNSWQEARQYLLKKSIDKMELCSKRLNDAQGEYLKIKEISLTEP